MTEKDFQKRLMAGFESEGIKCHKFPDSARAITKPFDIVANFKGEFTAIECKLKKFSRMSPNDQLRDGDVVLSSQMMRPHQAMNLKDHQSIGGMGLIAAGIVNEANPFIKAAWLIDIEYFAFRPVWTVGVLRSAHDQWRLHVGQPFVRELNWRTGFGWTVFHERGTK